MIRSFIKVLWIFLITIFFLPSCASLPKTAPPEGHSVFIGESKDEFINRYTPLFVIENDREPYNLIGTPHARYIVDGRLEVYVDSGKPSIFFEKRSFQTSVGSYTNLIYRIHFDRVPLSILPFYIGKGNNVGLFVIVTVNGNGEPLLYTAVHTCGCYLAFVPTSYMPEDAMPDRWNREKQSVLGEKLPGLLKFPPLSGSYRKPVFLIRSGNHRVKDVWIDEITGNLNGYKIVETHLVPTEHLENLPLEGDMSTSFFETTGPRKGYVKSSNKPWEKILMSWWIFDWRVGEDKRLGKDKTDGPVFYTSLKPWNREESDMRDFAAFLKYWGWKL